MSKATFFCWLPHNDLLSFSRGCYKLLQVPFVHSVCGIIYKRSEREHLLWLCELAEAPSRNASPSQVLSIKTKKIVQQATICAKCTDSPHCSPLSFPALIHILSISLIDGFWQGTFPWAPLEGRSVVLLGMYYHLQTTTAYTSSPPWFRMEKIVYWTLESLVDQTAPSKSGPQRYAGRHQFFGSQDLVLKIYSN